MSTCNCLCQFVFSLHADHIESDSDAEEAEPHYKPMWVRWLAVFVVVAVGAAAADSPEAWQAATATFTAQKEQWEKVFENLPHCGKISRPPRFMRRWFENVKAGNHTCEDAHRSGRPRVVPPAVAKRAAEIVKKGRWVKVQSRRGAQHRLVYYTSIQEAVDHSSELQSILADHHINVEQLRAAMHDADPDLVRRRLTFKRALSKEEKADRVKTSKALLREYEQDPSLLQRMVFIDETSIVLQGGGHEAVAVWCDKNDVNFNDVCPLPVPNKSNPTKVHIIVAVSAHPAFANKNGLVYVEFTTGTSHIQRRHNKRMDGGEKIGNWVYQVGAVAGLLHGSVHQNTFALDSSTQPLLPRHARICQRIHIRLFPALPLYVTASIAGCQHHSGTVADSIPASNQCS